MLRRDPEVDRRGQEEVTPHPADLSSDPAGDDAARKFSGVFALDGPSGTGKSTVARRLAQRLGAKYLDTGAMYRAATLAVLEAGVPVDEPDQVAAVVREARIEVATDPAHPETRLNGRRVDGEIRSADVTAEVSAVSAIPSVRQVMVAQQRTLIGDGRIVVEGRDIGSVVWPAARPKVYLTASAEARAHRRAAELGRATDVASVGADLRRRDMLDSSRLTSPLARAEDAIDVDTTDLGIDQVVDRLVDMVLRAASADV
jgi:cytidylate kinase